MNAAWSRPQGCLIRVGTIMSVSVGLLLAVILLVLLFPMLLIGLYREPNWEGW